MAIQTPLHSSHSMRRRFDTLKYCRWWHPRPQLLRVTDGIPVIAAYTAGDDFTLIVPCPICVPSGTGRRRRQFAIHVHEEPERTGDRLEFLRHPHCNPQSPNIPIQYQLEVVGDWHWERPEGVRP